MLRRIALAAMLLLTSAAIAQAQGSWPDRPIKFVVHVAAGGGFDLMARMLADRLSRQLPQPIIIENNGSARRHRRRPQGRPRRPDGYTFLFVGPGFASVPFLHKQQPTIRSPISLPVSLVTRFPQLLVIKPDLPAKNLASSSRSPSRSRASSHSGRAASAARRIFRPNCSCTSPA